MDIRDTVSRVLLGVAFGFVMGIVMYQSTGLGSRLQNGIFKGQVTTSSSDHMSSCFAANEVDCGDGICCNTDYGECMSGTCVPLSSSSATMCPFPDISCGSYCCTDGQTCNTSTSTCQGASSSWSPACIPPQFQCGVTCCSGGQTCNSSTLTCQDASSSWSACPDDHSYCGAGVCCDNSSGHCEAAVCVPNSSSSSVLSTSSSAGCCNTITNTCE